MKKFKALLILCAAIVLMVTSCTKQQQEEQLTYMTYEQLSTHVGKQNAFEIFDKQGKTELIDQSGTVSRGPQNKKVKPGATVAVLFDLNLEVFPSGDIVYSTSPEAEWGGVTKFLTQTSNDGALGIWSCNRHWDFWDVVEPTVLCSDSSTSGYNLRAFTSDRGTYIIHLSDWVVVP